MKTPREIKQYRQKLYEVIFEADTKQGRLFNVILLLCIFASVGVIILESVESVRDNYGGLLRGLEWFFTIIFTLEYAARLWPVNRKRHYIVSFVGMIDLLAIVRT